MDEPSSHSIPRDVCKFQCTLCKAQQNEKIFLRVPTIRDSRRRVRFSQLVHALL